MLEGSQGAMSSSVPNTFQQSLDADMATTGDWQVCSVQFCGSSVSWCSKCRWLMSTQLSSI